MNEAFGERADEAEDTIEIPNSDTDEDDVGSSDHSVGHSNDFDHLYNDGGDGSSHEDDQSVDLSYELVVVGQLAEDGNLQQNDSRAAVLNDELNVAAEHRVGDENAQKNACPSADLNDGLVADGQLVDDPIPAQEDVPSADLNQELVAAEQSVKEGNEKRNDGRAANLKEELVAVEQRVEDGSEEQNDGPSADPNDELVGGQQLEEEGIQQNNRGVLTDDVEDLSEVFAWLFYQPFVPNPNAPVFIPARDRIGPLVATVEWTDNLGRVDEDGTVHSLCVCFPHVLKWSDAIKNRFLLEIVSAQFPFPLPLQVKAMYAIRKNTFTFDVLMDVPRGLGSTTSWLLSVIDACLMNRRHSPNEVDYLVVVTHEEVAKTIKEEFEMIFHQLPRHQSFKVHTMWDADEKLFDNLRNHGAKVFITDPVNYINKLKWISVKNVIIDRYEEINGNYIAYTNFLTQNMKKARNQVKTVFITNNDGMMSYPGASYLREQQVRIVATLGEERIPKMDFVYVKSNEEAYRELKKELSKPHEGTTIVFTNGCGRWLIDELSQEIPHLAFGYLEDDREYDLAKRRSVLTQYRRGSFDVLIAPHSLERLLECRHRTLDISFVIPTRGFDELQGRVNQRCRINVTDSLVFLDYSNREDMDYIIECTAYDDYDTSLLTLWKEEMDREFEQERMRRQEEVRRREEEERRRQEEERRRRRWEEEHYDDEVYNDYRWRNDNDERGGYQRRRQERRYSNYDDRNNYQEDHRSHRENINRRYKENY